MLDDLSEDMWIIVCYSCDWHSNVCAEIPEECPVCKEWTGLLKIIGNSEDVGGLIKAYLRNGE